MKYSKAIREISNEGAIRIYDASKGWRVAYRIKNGIWQARNLNKVGEDNWLLGDRIVGHMDESRDGWYEVEKPHRMANPLPESLAGKNKGYFLGLTRRCETCKKVKSLNEFERDDREEQGYRTWECNQCAEERAKEIKSLKEGRVGDYLRRSTHASRPPVESEI